MSKENSPGKLRVEIKRASSQELDARIMTDRELIKGPFKSPR